MAKGEIINKEAFQYEVFEDLVAVKLKAGAPFLVHREEWDKRAGKRNNTWLNNTKYRRYLISPVYMRLYTLGMWWKYDDEFSTKDYDHLLDILIDGSYKDWTLCSDIMIPNDGYLYDDDGSPIFKHFVLKDYDITYMQYDVEAWYKSIEGKPRVLYTHLGERSGENFICYKLTKKEFAELFAANKSSLGAWYWEHKLSQKLRKRWKLESFKKHDDDDDDYGCNSCGSW